LEIQRRFEALENRGPFFWTVVGIISIGFLGFLDYQSGNEFTFSLFYLAPILLVTWVSNLKVGQFLSLLSALTLLGVQTALGLEYSHPIFYFLNTVVRTAIYFILTALVDQLKKTQKKDQLAARTDFVTGIANRRYFIELLETEVERSRRYPHPITVVYMDMDNFKQVNDLFGHKMGDEVLRYIASTLKSQLRNTDIIARLGGDEFALLLLSARLQEAGIVISKVRTSLAEEMKQRNWPVTFSIGAVICIAPPHSADQIIDMADQLMYEVKNSTKNDVRFAVWDGKNFRSVKLENY
jgi:diguanylate cyclase (GGDEF)-like protein